MTDPISIHNVPAQLDVTGRPKQDQRKRNHKPHDGNSGGGENASDDEAPDGVEESQRAPSRRGSDGIVGTQIDVEA